MACDLHQKIDQFLISLWHTNHVLYLNYDIYLGGVSHVPRDRYATRVLYPSGV